MVLLLNTLEDISIAYPQNGLISHSSGIISFDVALTSGSQVNIFRIKRRNWSFSSPGGIVVTNSSSEVFGIGTSEAQFPVIALGDNRHEPGKRVILTLCIKVGRENGAVLNDTQGRRA